MPSSLAHRRLIAFVLMLCSFSGTAPADEVTERYEHVGGVVATLDVSREHDRHLVRLEGGVPSGGGAATPADCVIEARGSLNGTSLEAHFGPVETETLSYGAAKADREGRRVQIMFEGDRAEVVTADTFGYCGLGADFTGRYEKVEPSPQ